MKNILSIVMLSIALTGCKGFLEEYSQDMVTPKTVEDLNEMMLGSAYIIPSSKVEFISQGSIMWWLQILDDDCNTVMSEHAPGSYVQSMNDRCFGYSTWQLEVGRDYTKAKLANDRATWDDLYRRINVCNIIIAEITENQELKSNSRLADLNRLKAECLALRANFYLYLVNIYGNAYEPSTCETALGVPIKLTHYVEHDKNNQNLFQRSPIKDVYDQIVSDLTQATALFKDLPSKEKIYRQSWASSMVLLSRVYLYMQKWELAKQIAEEYIQSGITLSNITRGINNSFITVDNPEVLFSQGSVNVQNSFKAFGGDYCVSKDLYNLYDENDGRIDFFTKSFVDSIALTKKYTTGLYRSYLSDIFMIRNVEALLNAAEACAMLDLNNEANSHLDQIRRNRITNYENSSVTGEDLINAIRDERRKELCFEGHRWFDLRRYSVCGKNPLKKRIGRVFCYYDEGNRNKFVQADYYYLEPDDLAYTFQIPKEVVDYDNFINNDREERKPEQSITEF